ncbi:MAG: replication-relaxation family protein [Anaerolineae bacterium]
MALTRHPILTARDRLLLNGLLDYGLLTLAQVQACYFPTSQTTIQAGQRTRRYGVTTTVLNRLYALEKAGWVALSTHAETARYPDTRVVWLGRGAAQVMAQELKLPIQVLHWHKPHSRLMQIPHDLMATTLRLRLETALRQQPECELVEWLSGRLLAADSDSIAYTLPLDGRQVKKTRRIVADSFCVLSCGGSISRFPIETDHSSLSQTRILKEKIHAGLAYIHSPQYRKRYGDNQGRWLFVMESEKRLKNLQALVLRELGKVAASAFYFTSFEAVKTQNVLTDPIWWLGGAAQTPQALWYALKNRV